MSRTRTGEVPAPMAVLGLLVQQPDTGAGVKLRLEDEHPGALWQRNIIHNSVPSLVDTGLVRVARSGREPSLDRLEATPAGVEHLRRWLSESSVAIPPQRDALLAKLKYIDAEDQLELILSDIEARAKLCAQEADAATERYNKAMRLRRLHPRSEPAWKSALDRAIAIHEVRSWSEQAKALRRMCAYLEDPHGNRDTLIEVEAGDG